MRIKLILFPLLSWLLIGCKNNHMTEMRKMYQHQISFKDISDSLNISQQIKIIVYYDSTHCAICQLKQIHNWNKYIEYLNALTPDVSVYFIISPSNEQIKNTTLNIQHLKLTPYNIILDSTNTFKKINPVIPLNNSSLHTFLLDKNNRIVLIGNPLNGDAMWELFKSTLENMLAHDGEYVPEN